jgi:hypothetical protein|nr:MAG TPA: major capsid protein [Caudoviricetes sp.]
MAKYNFEDSRYAKFFASPENNRFLQSFLDNSALFYTNYGWYKTQGRIAVEETPTHADGTAVFSAKARKLKAPHLMDLRAPLGDSNQAEPSKVLTYSASIPDFIAEGIVETATERSYKVKMFEQFGNDADIVAAYVSNLQDKFNSVDSTMTFMTAQLMTTAKIDYTGIGRGIQLPLHKADVPTSNFLKAGVKTWADADCKLLTQMRVLEEKVRHQMGDYAGPMLWQMTRNDFYNIFLNNKEVRAFVSDFRKRNNQASTQEIPVVDSEWNKAVVDLEGISPIEIVVEQENNKTHTKEEVVKGWKDGTVVLRPAGDAVEFQHKAILDEQMIRDYGADAITSVFGRGNDGLSLVVNSTVDNGRFKEWHTDVMMSACPALIEFPNHYIIDINTAD